VSRIIPLVLAALVAGAASGSARALPMRATPPGSGRVAASLAAPAPATEPVTVSKPWFRYIAPQIPAGGYMTLTNHTDHPAVLTGAASSACGMLMVHRSEAMGHTETMMSVPSVTVPSGGSISFAPGGYHLMCMQPAMAPGDRVCVTLSFQGGQTVSASFPVLSATSKPRD
jgi:copper(I)-binding protein